jgi:tetratricopeptide (TPR) repeat protein
MAELIQGMGLSIQSVDPIEAQRHLLQAEQLLQEPRGFASRVTIAKLRYQMSNVNGQLGDIPQAIALAQAALELSRREEGALDLQRSILVYNNIAYYLSLLHDPKAADYARAGLARAREKGTLSHQPYLLSTLGEIALDQNDLATAEMSFQEGLALAERLNMPERIAGLNMNLGLVAMQLAKTDLAISRLREAWRLADQLGNRHLAVRVRIALASLLPQAEARSLLDEARMMAEDGNFTQLIAKIAALSASI